MEEKSTRGGKRIGAGRKPIDNPKKQFTFYFKKRLTYKFGGEEKMKDKVYEFVEKYGEVELPKEQPKVFDAPKIPNNFQDEPKQWAEPKPLNLVRRKTVEQYILERLDILNHEDYMEWLDKLNADQFLSEKQKQLCKTGTL